MFCACLRFIAHDYGVSSWGSLVTQLVKNLPAMQETWVQSLGWKDSMEKGKATCREPARESLPITRLCGRVLVGKASQNSRGAPLGLPEHLPQIQSLPTLLLCALTYTSDFMGGHPPPPSLPLKKS